MIPTLEKNHPQTVGADSIATYGLGSESTCVHWPDCPRRGLVQAPEIPLWNGPEAVRRGSPDPAVCWTVGLPPGLVLETFGRPSGKVRRPCHNLARLPAPRSRASPGDSTLPTRLSGQGKKFPELSTILKRLPS